MDTDDLSREAYNGIIVEAEKLNHDLTLHFGLLSYECENETQFIDKSRKLANKIQKLSNYELNDLFLGNSPDKDQLNFTLRKIINNIEDLNKVPLHKRHYSIISWVLVFCAKVLI